MSGRGGQVRHSVSFVLELWDDFMDRPISDASLNVYTEDKKRPIRKKGGFYVFTNASFPAVVTIESAWYEREEIRIPSMDRRNPVIKRRLSPGHRYPLPEGTTFVQGLAAPDVRVEVSVEDDSALWRLLSDYDAEKTPDRMELFNPFEKELEGRRFYIRDREGKKEEFFQIQSQEARTGKIRLAEALEHAYKKAGTKLYECSSTRADAEGRFQIPLKVRTQGKKEILCRIGIEGRIYEAWIETEKTAHWEQPQGQVESGADVKKG